MTTKDFNPIFDRVLIKREKSNIEKRADRAGIIMTDQSKSNFQASEGVLVKCGDGCHEDVKNMIGKAILFSKFSGDDIKIGNNEYVLATDKDVFGEIVEIKNVKKVGDKK